jgi:hypothetical protein
VISFIGECNVWKVLKSEKQCLEQHQILRDWKYQQ